jgi:hypothetical protein
MRQRDSPLKPKESPDESVDDSIAMGPRKVILPSFPITTHVRATWMATVRRMTATELNIIKLFLEMNIPHVASLLGIDPVTEPQYLWIANMAASAEVDPNEWKEFTNENGETMYYNLKLKVISYLHANRQRREFNQFIQ